MVTGIATSCQDGSWLWSLFDSKGTVCKVFLFSLCPHSSPTPLSPLGCWNKNSDSSSHPCEPQVTSEVFGACLMSLSRLMPIGISTCQGACIFSVWWVVCFFCFVAAVTVSVTSTACGVSQYIFIISLIIQRAVGDTYFIVCWSFFWVA